VTAAIKAIKIKTSLRIIPPTGTATLTRLLYYGIIKKSTYLAKKTQDKKPPIAGSDSQANTEPASKAECQARPLTGQ
jgi:hypothetical protein